MEVSKEPNFDAPLPGMSLTAELGARPWQSPAQFSTVDDTIDYYMSRMSTEEFMLQAVDIMEMGVPVSTLANTIQMGSVMEGIHSVDTGMLVIPVIMEMLMLLAESAGIDYDDGLNDPTSKETRPSQLAKVMVKYQKTLDETDIEQVKEEKDEEEKEEPKSGLMARRK